MSFKNIINISLGGCFMIWVAIGCNTQSKNNETDNSATSSSSTSKVDTVIIDQMKFAPAELNIKKGDTVLFINNDIVPHNATAIDKAWQSPTLQMGDSWKVVPDKSADYYCSIHLVMKGKINVQ